MKTPRINCSPEMLLELRSDPEAVRAGKAAYSDTKLAEAFSFGWKFRSFAKGMTTWQIDAACCGSVARHELATLEATEAQAKADEYDAEHGPGSMGFSASQ